MLHSFSILVREILTIYNLSPKIILLEVHSIHHHLLKGQPTDRRLQVIEL